jgi:hypothetical protein
VESKNTHWDQKQNSNEVKGWSSSGDLAMEERAVAALKTQSWMIDIRNERVVHEVGQAASSMELI